jgi:hypothetical protein
MLTAVGQEVLADVISLLQTGSVCGSDRTLLLRDETLDVNVAPLHRIAMRGFEYSHGRCAL